MLGPLVTLGSWIAGRSIPHDVYASASWGWMKAEGRGELEDTKA